MKSPYLKTKLWNAVQKANVLYELDLEESLHNISVNGRKRGCCGHIINKRNGKCVYLTTEEACGARFANKSMIRYAKENHISEILILDMAADAVRTVWKREAI